MTFDKEGHGLKTGTGLEMLKSGTGLDNLEKPLPPDELGKHIIVTYQRLRLGMGFIALFFPLIIVAFGLLYKIELETSYSAYYFGLPAGDLGARTFPGIFPTRVFFCGLLFALGVFLILYKGFNRWEDILLMIAGLAAICVAIFPMWYKDMYYIDCSRLLPPLRCAQGVKVYPESGFKYEFLFRLFSQIHYGSAIVLFSCMTLVAWFCSKTTLIKRLSEALDNQARTWADRHPKGSSFLIAWLPALTIPFLYVVKNLPTQRDTFRRNYNWIGFAMALFPVTGWAVTSLMQWDNYLVLAVEAFGIWTFAAFWLLKSHELMLSQPEEKAIKGNQPKAYTVSELEPLDPTAQAAFTPLAHAAMNAAGGRTLNTGGGKVVGIDGPAPPKRVVINEWDSLDQAEAHYKSKAWNDFAPQRDKAIKTIRRYAVESGN